MIFNVIEILMLQIQDLVESYRKAWEESKLLRVQGNRLEVTIFWLLYELHYFNTDQWDKQIVPCVFFLHKMILR